MEHGAYWELEIEEIKHAKIYVNFNSFSVLQRIEVI